MTYYEAIRDLTISHMERFLDQVFLTGYNAGHQSLVDPDIDDENPYTEEWLTDDVEDSPFLVEDENGEALIISQLASVIIKMAEYDIDLMPEDVSWQSLIVLPRDSQVESTDSEVSEPVNEYGVSEDFEGDFDLWVASGKPDRGHLYVGVTSPALKSIGVSKSKIVWDTSKLNKIQRDHPDKERTDTWLTLNRLQLPFGVSKYGSIGNVALFERDVNGNYSFSSDNDEGGEVLPGWKVKLQDVNLCDSDDT